MVTNKRYPGKMKKIWAISAELAEGKKVSTSHKGVVSVDVGVNVPKLYRTYLIPTLEQYIISCSSLDKYRATNTFSRRICTFTIGD